MFTLVCSNIVTVFMNLLFSGMLDRIEEGAISTRAAGRRYLGASSKEGAISARATKKALPQLPR